MAAGHRGAAKRLGRHYIGIEQDKKYVSVATQRIAAIRPVIEDSLLELTEKRAQPRVPFGALIEGGLLQTGDTLFDKSGQHQARIRADGSLITKSRLSGSIHGLGANCKINPLVMAGNIGIFVKMWENICIDQLREEYRALNMSADKA